MRKTVTTTAKMGIKTRGKGWASVGEYMWRAWTSSAVHIQTWLKSWEEYLKNAWCSTQHFHTYLQAALRGSSNAYACSSFLKTKEKHNKTATTEKRQGTEQYSILQQTEYLGYRLLKNTSKFSLQNFYSS